MQFKHISTVWQAIFKAIGTDHRVQTESQSIACVQCMIQTSTFMAVSQSVVRGPLGGPTGFQRGPWLVPKVWFGDLWGALQGFKGVLDWFPKCGSGTSGGPYRVSKGSLAGSQSVVRGPLWVPEGFLGPWPRTAESGDYRSGTTSAPVRLWGLGLGLQSSQRPPGVTGTPGDHRQKAKK